MFTWIFSYFTVFLKNRNISFKIKRSKVTDYAALSLSDVVFIMLISVKMPAIIGISAFMSRIDFVLSLDEHGKSFITSGPKLWRLYYWILTYTTATNPVPSSQNQHCVMKNSELDGP